MLGFASKFFNFKRNLLGIISLSYIVFVFFISVFAYVIAPDNSKNANQMNLSIHSKKPGFNVKMLVYEETLSVGETSLINAQKALQLSENKKQSDLLFKANQLQESSNKLTEMENALRQ